MQRAFGQGAVAEEDAGDGAVALHLVRQRTADSKWQARADDAIGAKHADRHIGDMHRAAGRNARKDAFLTRQAARHFLGIGLAVAILFALTLGPWLSRRQAVRMVGEDYAWLLDRDCVGTMFHQAAEQQIPIMVFVGNRGCIQIHSGPVTSIKPMGPWIETDVNLDALETRVSVNGTLTTHFHTNAMVFGVARFISVMSCYMTLHPGDIIATGTPAGVGPVVDGDRIRIEIERVGGMTVDVVQGSGGHCAVFDEPYLPDNVKQP